MHQFWGLREASDDNLGLACSISDGLVPGRTPLIERRDGRFAVREKSEIERLLRRAYGSGVVIEPLMPGLTAVAKALDANDLLLARIAAVHLKMPDLADGFARQAMEAEDRLIKYGDGGGANWNPTLHPRAGTPPNPGWFAPSSGSSEPSSQTTTTQNARNAPNLETIVADNRSENKQVNDIVVKLKMSPVQRQMLHREISGMGYSYHEILEIAKDMFGK